MAPAFLLLIIIIIFFSKTSFGLFFSLNSSLVIRQKSVVMAVHVSNPFYAFVASFGFAGDS